MSRYTMRAVSESGGPYNIFVTFSGEYIRSLLPDPLLFNVSFKVSYERCVMESSKVLIGLLEEFQEWLFREGRLPISQSSELTADEGFEAKFVFEKKQDAAMFRLFFDGGGA